MDDGYKQAFDGLLRKRGELTSEVDGLRIQLGEKLAALDHVDAAIRVFKPESGEPVGGWRNGSTS